MVKKMAIQSFGEDYGIYGDSDLSDGKCAVGYNYPEIGFKYSFASFQENEGADSEWAIYIAKLRPLKDRIDAEIKQSGIPARLEVVVQDKKIRISMRSPKSGSSEPIQIDMLCKRSEKSIACLQSEPAQDSLENLSLDTPADWPYPEWLPLLENLP